MSDGSDRGLRHRKVFKDGDSGLHLGIVKGKGKKKVQDIICSAK